MPSSFVDGPAQTYARRELGSDADITRPHNPSIEIPPNPAWHVHLEVHPDQLVALHRLGFTSGALAWREGMEKWQPLRAEGSEPPPAQAAPTVIESPGESADAVGHEIDPDEEGEVLDPDADTEGHDVHGGSDSAHAQGTDASATGRRRERHTPGRPLSERTPSTRPTAIDATRRGFVFPRGRRGVGITFVHAAPVATTALRPPPPRLPLTAASLPEDYGAPLPPPPRMPTSFPAPRAASEFVYEPAAAPTKADSRLTPLPRPLALVPKPAWLTRALENPGTVEKSSVPPLSFDTNGTVVRTRTLWMGAGALVVLSACVAALVSSIVWRMHVEDGANAGGAQASWNAQIAGAAPKQATGSATTSTEPEQPTGVPIEQLPLLKQGARAPAAMIRSESGHDGSNDGDSNSALRSAMSSSQRESARERESSSERNASPEARMAERLRAASRSSRTENTEPAPLGAPDRDAIARAVANASSAARSCGSSPESGQVMVKFGPSGSAQSIQLLKPFSNRDTNACVLRAMSRARVPAFAGDAVTVRKSVRW